MRTCHMSLALKLNVRRVFEAVLLLRGLQVSVTEMHRSSPVSTIGVQEA
jgi:hypothetical protein